MKPTEYINALDKLQEACSEMILESSRFKKIFLHDPDQISDTDEYGAGKQALGEALDELHTALSKTHKVFYIPKKPLRIVDMPDGTKKKMWS